MADTTKAPGSDIVLRGMMLLALMLIVVIAGYAIFFHGPGQSKAPTPQVRHDLLVMVVQPTEGFPGAFSWGALAALGDEMPSTPGWQTRFEAARSLAYHGSSEVPWEFFREMLDEHRMFCNFHRKLDNGTTVIEEAKARQIMLGALKDLAHWHTIMKDRARITPDKNLFAVYHLVDQLAQSEVPELKKQAEETRGTLFR